MKGYPPVYQQIFGTLVHAPIHLFVNEAENYGFVAHKSLVVAFRIGDGPFIRPLVCKLVPYLARTPIFILLFFYPLYPMVGYSHCHTEVKTHTSLLERGGQTGHAAHIFRNGDGIGIDFVDKTVCKS